MATHTQKYAASLRIIHWLTVLAILGAYLLSDMEGGEEAEGAATSAMQWHYLAGLIVLLLVVPRLFLRAYTPTPPIVPAPGAFNVYAARVVHLALYAFLILQPILGWLQVNYGGELVSLPWFGWHLPALVQPDPRGKELMGEFHEWLGETFYWVIGLHVLAALWHHFVRHDNTLRRML